MKSMKSIGIIGEYNPFHLGHKYLIEKAVKLAGADVCVSVMSGNFTQRGEPAVFDKWERARAAVENGINLVVELPVIYAANSAEYFAKGSVEILEGFGYIDNIVFGSEEGDIEDLKEAASFVSDNYDELHRAVQELTKNGVSYPKARQMALTAMDGEFNEMLVSEPNNILAIEYIKQLDKMEPITIKRRGHGYHRSATVIRERLNEEDPIKFEMMNNAYFQLVSAKILQSDAEYLEQIFAAGAGLGNKLKKEIRYVDNTEQLIEKIKSKVYTRTRISRLLTQVLLGIDREAVNSASNYIRILAFDQIGAQFLKTIKKKECAKLPIITNINKEMYNIPEIKKTLEKDILASDIYNIICKNDLYNNSDYTKTPYIKL